MTDKKTEREIASILAGHLKKHARIQIDGLGTFSVEHKKQEQHQEKDGSIVMKPPVDTIAFTPEKEGGP